MIPIKNDYATSTVRVIRFRLVSKEPKVHKLLSKIQNAENETENLIIEQFRPKKQRGLPKSPKRR